MILWLYIENSQKNKIKQKMVDQGNKVAAMIQFFNIDKDKYFVLFYLRITTTTLFNKDVYNFNIQLVFFSW